MDPVKKILTKPEKDYCEECDKKYTKKNFKVYGMDVCRDCSLAYQMERLGR